MLAASVLDAQNAASSTSQMMAATCVSLSPTQAVNWQGQPLYDPQGQPISVTQLQEALATPEAIKDLTKKDGVSLTPEEGQALKQEFIQWMASQTAEQPPVQPMVAQTSAPTEVVIPPLASHRGAEPTV